MIEDRDQTFGAPSQDLEERASAGGADTPPEQPDQPAEGNREFLRDRKEEEGADKPAQAPPGGDNPHGDYPSLPGYGG